MWNDESTEETEVGINNSDSESSFPGSACLKKSETQQASKKFKIKLDGLPASAYQALEQLTSDFELFLATYIVDFVKEGDLHWYFAYET